MLTLDASDVVLFQSTPSAWRETTWARVAYCVVPFQSTPSAWRETHYRTANYFQTDISIHSLRMEGDEKNPLSTSTTIAFQSTPSAWRETDLTMQISIILAFQSTPSAWRETCDWFRRSSCCFNFNPLPPHGGRLQEIVNVFSVHLFQSTPSAWRETDCRCPLDSRRFISIHSLRMEGDRFHRPLSA